MCKDSRRRMIELESKLRMLMKKREQKQMNLKDKLQKIITEAKNTDYKYLAGAICYVFESYFEDKKKWVKINNELDLPKENGVYWVLYEDKPEPVVLRFLNGKWILDFGNITHYQFIKKPQLPV